MCEGVLMKIFMSNYISGITTEDIAKRLCFWVKPKKNYDVINELPYPDYVYRLADFLTYGHRGDPNKHTPKSLSLTSDELLAYFQEIQAKHNASTTFFYKWLQHFNEYYTKLSRLTFIHIDSHDLFNMDYTLAQIILPMLKKLKQVKHGSPDVKNEDVPEHLRSDCHQFLNGEVDKYYHERWDYVLNEMIFAFEYLCSKELQLPAHSDVQKRVQNGLTLFGKYYLSLYD